MMGCLTGAFWSPIRGNYQTLGSCREAISYRNPTADFSAYDKILLEPVAIWYTEGSTLHNAPREDLQRLADEFYAIVRKTLGTNYEMVDNPGPGVMRIRLALTEAEKSSLSLDLRSDPSLPPLASKERKVATYLQAFVGKAGAEGEFTDAQSGKLLAAAVDRRTGDKSFTVVTNSWDDVREVFQFWATQMDERLREWRSTSGT